MKTTYPKQLGSFTLSLLLLLPALPAGAGVAPAAEPQSDLRLAEALSEPAPMLRLRATPAATGLGLRLAGSPFDDDGSRLGAGTAEVDLEALRAEAWRAPAAAQAGGGSSGKSQKRGFGRWLKKRWWVPVLAIAVGAAVGSGSDSDSGGEED